MSYPLGSTFIGPVEPEVDYSFLRLVGIMVEDCWCCDGRGFTPVRSVLHGHPDKILQYSCNVCKGHKVVLAAKREQ